MYSFAAREPWREKLSAMVGAIQGNMSDTNTDRGRSCANAVERRHSLVSACDRESRRTVATVEKSGDSYQSADTSGVLVAVGNRFLREALTHMLRKRTGMNVQELDLAATTQRERLSLAGARILLLSSSGCMAEDLKSIQQLRTASPKIRILLLAASNDEDDFSQCLRAGIRGYLPQDASGEEVRQAVEVIAAGGSVCPASLCGALFRNLNDRVRL